MEANVVEKDVQKAARATRLAVCYQCAMCGAGCPVARLRDDYRPMLIFMRTNLEDMSILKEPGIWYCATCFNCQEVCPLKVKGTDFIFLLKNCAAKLGNVPAGVKIFGRTLLESGSASPISDFMSKKRKKMGLPELPPIAMDEVTKILKRTGFDKLVGCDTGGER